VKPDKGFWGEGYFHVLDRYLIIQFSNREMSWVSQDFKTLITSVDITDLQTGRNRKGRAE
jgi:hypothetical protein